MEEARKLKTLLQETEFDAAFAGTARRCQETLQLIVEGRSTTIVIEPLLDEISYGEWEGLTQAEIKVRFPDEWQRFSNDPSVYVPPGGEALDECATRAVQWLEHAAFQCGIAVVDKTWLRVLICHLMNAPPSRYRDGLDIKIAGVTVLVGGVRGWRLDALNYGATSERVFGI